MPQKTLRRSFSSISSLAVAGFGLGGAAYIAFRWRHATSPDARTWAVAWLILCGLCAVVGVIRFLRRNKPDYFADEMSHRRSLVRDNRSYTEHNVKRQW